MVPKPSNKLEPWTQKALQMISEKKDTLLPYALENQNNENEEPPRNGFSLSNRTWIIIGAIICFIGLGIGLGVGLSRK